MLNFCHRVINVMKKWIEDHFYDFEDHMLLDRLRSFIFVTVSMQNPLWATSLEEIIHEKLICSIVCIFFLFFIFFSSFLSLSSTNI